MRTVASERAQAGAELIAIVPLLIASALALAQALVAGWALLSAGEAARAAARIAHLDGDAKAAARAAIPESLGPATVEIDGAEVRVELSAPRLIPGVPRIPVAASAALDPAAGS